MKRQLDRLKGKRLVTGDPNLMTKDEICINATPNGVEVKEIGTDGKIKDLAGSGGSSSDNKDEGQWYKTYFKAINPETGEEQVVYFPLLVDTGDLSMIFDRSVSYMTEYGGSAGNGYAIFYGDIPFDLSCRYKKIYDSFQFMYNVGIRLNKYNYDIVDYDSGVPVRYINTKSRYEEHIDYTISEWLKSYERKHSDKYLQYLHIIIILSVFCFEMSDYVKEVYNNHRYITSYDIMNKLKNMPEYTELIAMYNEWLFIEPTTKEELLQIAKEQVENYINKQ